MCKNPVQAGFYNKFPCDALKIHSRSDEKVVVKSLESELNLRPNFLAITVSFWESPLSSLSHVPHSSRKIKSTIKGVCEDLVKYVYSI